MMKRILKIPLLGESDDVATGTIISIPISVGDSVEVDDTVLEIETDKVTIEVPAIIAGKVDAILVEVDQEVSQGAEFAEIIITSETENIEHVINEGVKSKTHDDAPSSQEPVVEKKVSIEQHFVQALSGQEELNEPFQVDSKKSIIPASPSTRRLARKLGVNLSKLVDELDLGFKRISIADVERYVSGIISRNIEPKNNINEHEEENKHNTTMKSVAIPTPQVTPEANSAFDMTKYGNIRSEKASKIAIATSLNMSHAWSTIPHAWLQQRIDITDLETWRKEHKKDGGNLTITVIIAKAIAVALKEFPLVNSSFDEEKNLIHYKEYYDVGIAVDTPHGLVVPTLRGVERKGLEMLSNELKELSQLAQSRKLKPNDLKGAGITLSNLGGIGLNAIFPIVNWPQTAIVGVASSELVPKYMGDKICERRMMTTTLGFDHRVINGADGARFLMHLKTLLEDIRMLVI